MTNLPNTANLASAILLIACPDRKGLVSSITDFLYRNEGNIIDLEQHVDIHENMFFMRLEWDLRDFKLSREEFREAFSVSIAKKFSMRWKLYFSDDVPRMAVFVSKPRHCLYDILSRYQAGEWKVEIPVIISNHPDLEDAARMLGIDYHLLPISRENKRTQEQKQLALLADYRIDVIVLARYMQIVSPDFIDHFPNKIINIHHSFLPAFPGAKPYHSAYERGVKIIGATSHYVTAELDAGPIIEQDIIRVRHTDSIEDLMRKGQDVEKLVLSRAIWRHLNRQVLVYGNRTIVFG